MKKYTIEYISEVLKLEGYNLITSEYTGCKQKLECVCPKGHLYFTTFDNWRKGRRCPFCYGNSKLIYDDIKKSFELEGYKLLSTEYVGSGNKLKYKCPKGHIGFIKWDHWRDGHRCAECAGNKRKTIDDVKKQFESEGYELLSDHYSNSYGKLRYRCPKGHVGVTTYYNWLTGYRCLECSGKSKKTIDFIKNEFAKEGYTLITNYYLNCHQKLHLVCPNGHDYYVSWDNWNHSKSRCVKCKSWGTSNQEQLLTSFLSGYIDNIIENDRSIIPPYELDIVIPDKKIAIEYCGLYWHSELFGKDRRYHLGKFLACEEKGYRLITIFEDELVDNKEMIFSKLKNIIGIQDDHVTRIYARKCVVKEISLREASDFCNTNHLQGYAGSNVRLGLYYSDELVSVMTFSKPSIAKGSKNKEGCWELQRFCSKVNYSVVGGASKLLKYFERNYFWQEIYSYADRRWSDGNVYTKLNFEFKGTTSPNYWYLRKQSRIHRFALRKTKEDPKNKTEWEIRKSQGWNRIWDCGNLKFVRYNEMPQT